MSDTIRDVTAASVRASLPEPIVFGDWVMRDREFALVRVRADSGATGFAFTLTRESPVAAAVRQCLAPQYAGAAYDDPAQLADRAWRSNLASLSSGAGLRALSLVDLATWDLKTRAEGLPIGRLLGGEPGPMPATAIVGYPPGSTDADGLREQIATLREAGWRRFKLAITLPLERGRERALAAREAAGDDAWVGLDGAWLLRSVDEAAAFLESVADARLGWFEDMFPPGDAGSVAELRARSATAIAVGDEQGGAYYPDALLDRDAVDVVRLDLTCMGGLSRAQALIARCQAAGVAIAPHMNAHIHSRVFGVLCPDVPVEWGVQWTGVDPWADSLAQPVVADGMMEPLEAAPGFGPLVNPDWVREQRTDDPDRLIASL